MGKAMVSQMSTMPLLYFAMEVLSNYLVTKVKNFLTLEDELPSGKEVTKHILVKKHNQTTNSLLPSEIGHCATSKESGPTCSPLKCLTVLCLFHTRLGQQAHLSTLKNLEGSGDLEQVVMALEFQDGEQGSTGPFRLPIFVNGCLRHGFPKQGHLNPKKVTSKLFTPLFSSN